MFFHYLKIGIRQVNKYKIHHAISALCLAVGMVVFALTIQFIQARWEDHDKAYIELWDKNGNYTTCDDVQQITALQDIIGTDHPLLVQTISGGAATPQVTVTDLEGNSMPYKATCTEANEAVMERYRRSLTKGSRLPAQANEIIVSRRFASKIAGAKSPVGYTLTPHPWSYSFNNTETEGLAFRIVGVASIPSDFQMLFKREGISYATPVISITFTDRKQIKEWNEKLKNVKLSIRGVLCHPTLTPYESGSRSAELLLLFFSSLILISGIVHFLKFTFQMFYQRSRELTLRHTMGEKAKGTFQLLNTEIFILLTGSLILTFLLSQYAIEITEQYIFPEQLHWLIPSEIRLTLIGIYAGMMLLCMLFTLIPIYKLRKSNFIVELNRYGRHHKYRNFMIGLQMSIALLFLGLTLTVVSFADEVANIYYKTGVDDTRIFEIESDNFLFAQNREAIFSEIRQMPEIESALPYVSYLDGCRGANFEMNSGLQKKELDLNVIYSTSDYFNFFEYPEMSPIKDNKYYAYVNRKLYQVLQQTPTPHLLKVNDKSYAVAGVCDYFYNEWKERQQYMALIDVASTVVTRPKDFSWVFKINEKASVKKTKDKIESICRKFVPETLPLHIHPLNEQPEYKMFQQILQVVGLLTFVSILLMLLSIYSSVMLDVQTRQKEMALRKINGARKTDIFRIFIRDYCLCYLAAFAVVVLLTKALIATAMPERIEVINWVWAVKLFFSVGILIAVVLFKQVRHIMKLNPAEVTKYD